MPRAVDIVCNGNAQAHESPFFPFQLQRIKERRNEKIAAEKYEEFTMQKFCTIYSQTAAGLCCAESVSPFGYGVSLHADYTLSPALYDSEFFWIFLL